MTRRLPSLNLSIQYPGGKDMAPTRPQVRRWIRASCATSAELAVRFVDADEARTLNNAYRQKDYATNVLSFSYVNGDADNRDGTTRLAGDLVLCLPVVEREAREQQKALEAHFAHLIVHGMLHLQGYDHETGSHDAERMEATERQILSTLGYSDPYR